MLTIRQTRAGDRAEQHVSGTIDTAAELHVWAEATGHAPHRDLFGAAYAVIPNLGNGVHGGVVVRPGAGHHVSWWVAA